jgi:hypothetical protein
MPTWLVIAAALIILAFAVGLYFTVRTGGVTRRPEDEAEEMREKARANSNVFWGD